MLKNLQILRGYLFPNVHIYIGLRIRVRGKPQPTARKQSLDQATRTKARHKGPIKSSTVSTRKARLFTWTPLMWPSFWEHLRRKRCEARGCVQHDELGLFQAMITFLAGSQETGNQIPSRLQEHFRPPAPRPPLPQWRLVSSFCNLWQKNLQTNVQEQKPRPRQESRRPAQPRPFKGAPSNMQFFGPSDYVPELPHNVQVRRCCFEILLEDF